MIIARLVKVLKHEELSSDENVHLLNALCWNYSREDHEYLVQLKLLQTLQRGDGTIFHPLYLAWGKQDSHFTLSPQPKKDRDFDLGSRLHLVFDFLTQNLLESVFVKKDASRIDIGTETTQSEMQERAEATNSEASGELLACICDILFKQMNRYLNIKRLLSVDAGKSDKDA